ncbi:COG4 transport protein-domain-containing protein [Phascolomyces articulosus]|uniref:Conserved oligomeric Golgi complex subunit 4 n=1 Tax=Phascolomyces articulosus TaxID=60185 RepID=A0AAD5K899_9FUNG|nr:COG4 transport protein-domain-containing protein [Phascolomyces articulosus]
MPSALSSSTAKDNDIHPDTIKNEQDHALGSSLLARDFEALTNIDDIRECLRLLDEEETRIDASLDEMLSKESELLEALGTLDVLRPQLRNLKTDSGQMMNTITKTSRLAEGISDKVRQLDQEQSRAKESIHYVEDVQELKRCIAGIQEAMKHKDYDAAASLLQSASKIDQAILNGSLAEFTVPTSEDPDHPAKTLADAKSALFDIFSQRFDDAVMQRNETDITRYFKLFPLIGCQAEGLDRYSRFVCNIVKARCSEELRMGNSAAPVYYADTLTRLFENIAVIIDQHQPLVELHYGRGRMLRVIQRLQEESDIESGRILDQFVQNRKIESKLVEIQSLNIAMIRSSTTNWSTSPGSNGTATGGSNGSSGTGTMGQTNINNSPLTDPRQLDANLLELALISQRSALFYQFINERADDEMEQIGTDESTQDMIMHGKDKRYYGNNGLLSSSGLVKRNKELMNSYLVIDGYLLKRNIDKAMKLDDYDPASSQTSTCVDDVFFILKKVVKRSISTCGPEVVAATVKAILKTLDSGYLQVFQQKMSVTFAGQEPGTRNAERSAEQAKINYMVLLNNLNVSAEYMERLAQDARPEVKSAIWKDAEHDIKIATKALDDLAAASSKFRKLLQSGMEQLMGQILKPRVRPLFQHAYREVKYVLEEDEYNEADVDELFVKRFRGGFDKLIESYRRTLTDTNFASIMGLLLDAITAQWERIISQTRFNQYGALRFDKDLRSVIHHLSSMTEWLSRDRFTRLNQMATLLNFEEPSEIYDYWGAKAGPVSWRLTVAEIKKILTLRLDFDGDEVANLSLY